MPDQIFQKTQHTLSGITDKGFDMTQEEMIAAAIAHRVCSSAEHDPANGKMHGCCIVCCEPWPCDTAKRFMPQTQAIETKMSFDEWWKINGRPEWESTMAHAAWDASKATDTKAPIDWNDIRQRVYQDQSVVEASYMGRCDIGLVMTVMSSLVDQHLQNRT